jgi:acetoacetyl-CoA synthetase
MEGAILLREHLDHAPTANAAGSRAPTQLEEFAEAFAELIGEPLATHASIERAAIRHLPQFWQLLLARSGLRWDGVAEPAYVGDDVASTTFFPGLRLNYADNLLNPAFPSAQICLTAVSAEGETVDLTRAQLRARVEQLAGALRRLGLAPGDRVAAVTRNGAEAIVAALAVAALGGVYSSASPEMASDAMLDRFGQIGPAYLIANVASKPGDIGIPLPERIVALAAGLDTLRAVIHLDGALDLPTTPTHSLTSLLRDGPRLPRRRWPKLPFNHPLFIAFSSGTTGRPKCIVHGAGGVLLEQLKEHRLHCDMRPDDTLFFHTSCAWMMWNWQLAALASGPRIVVYDGPVSQADTLWKIVEEQRVTIFGTSPSYLRLCQDSGFEPGQHYLFAALRAILATGSILHDGQFVWVRETVKHVPLQSISGGTDIMGCFVLGSPILPVVDGTCQCRSLAMDVRALGATEEDPVGELVCANPFPSRPLGFLNDPDGALFRRSYFAKNPGLWTHGDLISFDADGSARMHGRSDGVLNIRGVRIGPAEIYRVVLAVDGIAAAMAVDQDFPEGSGGSLLLLVVMKEGVELSPAIASAIRRSLIETASPAHVPETILAVDALPTTHSGKQSEAALSDAVNGRPVRNLAALSNPQCLDAIAARLAKVQRPAGALEALVPVSLTDPDSLTAYLRDLWEQLLAMSPIDVDDDFFHLGGNSLLAARMLAELGRATQVDLPLNTLLHAPTIRALTRYLLASADRNPSKALLLRRGDGRPIFMVPSLAGNLLELWAVLRAMKTLRPIYGIEAGALGDADGIGSVEDMARHAAGLMRSIWPDGPYTIMGYSFGGLLAFEIARQLSEDGATVEQLVLVDALVSSASLPWHRRLTQLVNRPLRLAVQLAMQPSGQRAAFIRRRREARRMRAQLPGEIKALRSAIAAARQGYRPGPYVGSIDFIRPRHSEADGAGFWRSLAAQGVTEWRIAGDHQSMVSHHGTELATTLNAIFTA